MENKNTFETLRNVNLKEKLKEKLGLKYLSWANAWDVIKSIYPDAVRTIYKRGWCLIWEKCYIKT